MEALRRVDGQEVFRQFVRSGVRPDGRGTTGARGAKVGNGRMATCHGSGVCAMGGTRVLCGVKGEWAMASEASLVPNVELLPLCSPSLRPGPPPERALALSQMVLSLFSRVVDLKALTISEGKASWVLYADIICLSDDGNVLDAAILALMAALKNARLPQVEFDEASSSVYRKEGEPFKLPLLCTIFPITFALFEQEYLLVDPSAEEEEVVGAIFTLVFNAQGALVAFLKPGGTGVTDQQLKTCLGISKELLRKNKKHLEGA